MSEEIIKEISKMLSEILEKISDKNSCLTQLAKSRLEIITAMGRMSFNDGNDANGNWAKLKELKEQATQIDSLILALSKQ